MDIIEILIENKEILAPLLTAALSYLFSKKIFIRKIIKAAQDGKITEKELKEILESI